VTDAIRQLDGWSATSSQDNKLGTETHAVPTSTKFYLGTAPAACPDHTIAVRHVVEKVETYDRISRNRFVTRYAFHHGYFDGEERPGVWHEEQ
jgi:hypothetical protein